MIGLATLWNESIKIIGAPRWTLGLSGPNAVSLDRLFHFYGGCDLQRQRDSQAEGLGADHGPPQVIQYHSRVPP
jgi:hypothetical protein